VSFAEVQETERPLVIHDPLCPLTPAGFIEEAVEECEQSGAVVAGVRPVTDTVKEYDASPGPAPAARWLGATVDREELVCVTSPVVLPAAVVGSLASLETDDLARLVADLSTRFPVRLLQAPPLGRRIVGEPDIEVLDALSRATG
jgi:2-C-methyl-D-erythritol 4-phosphate cytidylyltransferase